MFDNGLLKYYRDKGFKDGFLDTKVIDYVTPVEQLNRRITKYNLPEGAFYGKGILLQQDAKKVIDAEVLLGQIYNKAGLNSAVYFPVDFNGQRGIISKDIETSSTTLAYDILRELESDNKQLLPIDFLGSSYSGDIVSSFFTKRGIEQYIKMRVLDTASFINERLFGDFLVTKSSGKIDDVSCLDFEESGLLGANNGTDKDKYFENDFSNENLSRDELIQIYRTSSVIRKYVDKTELAENIGTLNPQDIAQDIKQTLDYEVDPNFASSLANSYDEMAEILIQ